MGVYLRDYELRAPVPVEKVVAQMEMAADMVDRKEIAGYSILASVLFDSHRRQAEAVHDFIATH